MMTMKELVVFVSIAAYTLLQLVQVVVMSVYSIPYLKSTLPSYLDYHWWIFIVMLFSSLYNTIRYSWEVISAIKNSKSHSAVIDAKVSATYLETSSGVDALKLLFYGTLLESPFSSRHLFRMYMYGTLLAIDVIGSTLIALERQELHHGFKWEDLVLLFSPLGMFFSSRSLWIGFVVNVTRFSFLQLIGCAAAYIIQLRFVFGGGRSSLPAGVNKKQASFVYMHEVFGKHAFFTWTLPIFPDKRMKREDLAQEAKWI
eukprot:m.139464 g.139464  ORF g.139464 m.139464 type:complete len:257 (-) comp21714_c0_seq1:139-909(-)